MSRIGAIVFFLFIAGCSSIYQPDAVGIGYEPQEAKLSPCACILLGKGAGERGLWARTG